MKLTLKPQRCMYRMGANGTNGRRTGRCLEWAAPGSALCADHKAEVMASIRAKEDPVKSLRKALRWGPMYVETRAKKR